MMLTWLSFQISSLVLLLFSLSSATILPIPLVVSLVLVGIFILVESKYASDPVIPLAVLKSRGAFYACLATSGLMMIRWLVLFYTPVYAITVRGWSPSLAGSILIPANAGFAVGGLLAGWLHIRRAGSFYMSVSIIPFSCLIMSTNISNNSSPCILSFLLFSITLFALGQASTSTSPTWAYLLIPFFNGLCTGAALNYTLVHALHITPPSASYITSALMVTFRGFGASFGSAIGAGIFARVMTATFNRLLEERGLPSDDALLERLLGSPAIVGALDGIEKEVAIESFVASFQALFTAGGGIALIVSALQAGTGWKKGKVV